MIDARKGVVPELGDNDPLYRNIEGETVAMILIKQGLLPSREWLYDLDCKYLDCKTLR